MDLQGNSFWNMDGYMLFNDNNTLNQSVPMVMDGLFDGAVGPAPSSSGLLYNNNYVNGQQTQTDNWYNGSYYNDDPNHHLPQLSTLPIIYQQPLPLIYPLLPPPVFVGFNMSPPQPVIFSPVVPVFNLQIEQEQQPLPPSQRQQFNKNLSRELHFQLVACNDQLDFLEKDRTMYEAELAQRHPGKKLSSANKIPVPGLPMNPTRVDRLLVNEIRAYDRVITLMDHMEKLIDGEFDPTIRQCLGTWYNVIMEVKARRHQDFLNPYNRFVCSYVDLELATKIEDNMIGLVDSVKELTTATLNARTSMRRALYEAMYGGRTGRAIVKNNSIEDQPIN